MLFRYIKRYIFFYSNRIIIPSLTNYLTWSWLAKRSAFLDQFKSRNYLIWNEGLVIDFAQKKTIDLWLRKSVILTGFLFTDRFLFETIVRIFNDNLWTTLSRISSLEADNTLNVLSSILFSVSSLLILIFVLIVLVI